jgi:hypothetical protein
MDLSLGGEPRLEGAAAEDREMHFPTVQRQ